MNPISHSRAAQVVYQDLLRMHLDEAASEIVGSIEERQRNGRTYLYDRFRIGTEMKSRYLGEDSPDLRARLARAADLKAEAQERQKRMSRLARVLRSEGSRFTRWRSTAPASLCRSRALSASRSTS